MLRRYRIRTTSFGAAVLVFGLLLWARLLLLTGHPKMAIAQPSGEVRAVEKTSGAIEGGARATPVPAKAAPAAPAGSDATHSPHAGD